MKKCSNLLVASAAVLVVGCGGNGGGGSANGGDPRPGQEFSVGPFSGTGVVSGKTVSTNSSEWSAIGFSGNFSALNLRREVSTIDTVQILASMGTSFPTADLRLGYLNSNAVEPSYVAGNFQPYGPAMSPDGSTIVFTNILGNETAVLARMTADGKFFTNLTTLPSSGSDTMPTYSPTANEVAFIRYIQGTGTSLHKINLNTKAVSANLLPTGVNIGNPHYSNDGKFIYYVDRTSNPFVVRKVSSSGGTPIDVYSDPTYGVTELCDSPNGDGQIALVPKENSFEIRSVGGPYARVLLSDSRSGAFLRPIIGTPYVAFVSENQNGLLYRVLDVQTGETKTLWNSPQGTGLIASVPAVTKQVLAGTGGAFGSTLSGVIAARKGSRVGVTIGFKAVTASTVVMSSLSGDNTTGPNLDFEITADQINYVGYLSENARAAKVAVGTGAVPTTANGIFVSLDSESGKVVSIIAYNGSRSAKRYAKEGQDSVFEGQILAVYDEQGENIAQSGAARVRVSRGRVTVER